MQWNIVIPEKYVANRCSRQLLATSNVTQACSCVRWYAMPAAAAAAAAMRVTFVCDATLANETFESARPTRDACVPTCVISTEATTTKAGVLPERPPAGKAHSCRAPIRFCWWSRRKIRSSSVIGRVSVRSIYYRSAPQVVPSSVDITYA